LNISHSPGGGLTSTSVVTGPKPLPWAEALVAKAVRAVANIQVDNLITLSSLEFLFRLRAAGPQGIWRN